MHSLTSRQQRGPFIPSFSLAVRLLLLVRTAAAMYSVIADCDEGECGVMRGVMRNGETER